MAIEGNYVDVEIGVMHSVVLGSIVGIMIGLVTEYYTGIEPVFGIKTKAIPHIGLCGLGDWTTIGFQFSARPKFS
jgi:Na+/H+-translocating membrane pyrophosphatase